MASRIPDELIEKVGKCLNTRSDVSRFRAVCKSWRSAIPPYTPSKKQHHRFTITVMDPIPHNYTMTETVVYHVAPPAHDTCKTSWLVNVKEGELRETCLLHPFSQSTLNWPQENRLFTRVFNLLDYRTYKLEKLYTLKDLHNIRPNFKVVLGYLKLDDDFPEVMAIMNGRLLHGKLGADNNVSLLPDSLMNKYFEDVIFCRGKFYAVSRYKELVSVDSRLNVNVIVSEMLNDSSQRMNLVESFGELFLVERHYEIKILKGNFRNPELKFKIFKLNAEIGKWEELKKEDLSPDRVLIIGDDGSYFVSTQDFPTYDTRNNIYFVSGPKC